MVIVHVEVGEVCLGVWMEPVTAISIQVIPPYPAVGQSVTLSVTGITGNILLFNWYKGPNRDASNQILGYFPSGNQQLVKGSSYFPRASPLRNGSLLISDLEDKDSGIYTVTVQTQNPEQDASVTLTVYVPVTDPKIMPNVSQIKENDSVALTCETQNAEWIQWGRTSGDLPSDITRSKDNRTITFPSIKRSHAGDYYCEAENRVSKKRSGNFTLTVYYGPENVSITGDLNVTEGSSIMLECFATSLPEANFTWTHNGIQLKDCQKNCSREANSNTQGNYTCIASNSMTKITASLSVTVTVTVTEIVTVTAETLTNTTEGPGLPAGAIAGIVVAMVVVALIVALIYLFVILKKRKKPSVVRNGKPNVSVTVASGNGQTGDSGADYDIQYSTVNFSGRPTRKTQMQPNDDSVVYSDLRLS